MIVGLKVLFVGRAYIHQSKSLCSPQLDMMPKQDCITSSDVVEIIYHAIIGLTTLFTPTMT